MKNVFTGILIAATQLIFAQTNRNVGEFSSLKVYDKITVVLVPANENKIETNADATLETINKNGELKIRMAPTKVMQGDGVSVTVFYQNLNDIQASQGSSIFSAELVDAPMLSLTSNEGSKITLNVDANKLNIKANSGGIITISGNADNQDIVINSGGKYDAKSAESLTGKVTVNAGGLAEINVSESVNATTRAGGVINIYGDPNDRKVKNVVGGKINFK